MSGFDFDPMGDLKSAWASASRGYRWGTAITKALENRRQRKRAEEAQAREHERQEELLRKPPPLHGSATWAESQELARFLKGREAFDTPSSIILGAYAGQEGGEPVRFVHWDGEGHLLTVAPTRSGKSVTTIIPNLLRYRGSVIVIDPKSELYEHTSAWRAANVGPVYRVAPFDTVQNSQTAGYARHGYNPLTRVRTQADARALAELMFPRDPKSPEFFNEDAVAFMTGLILFILDEAPTERRTLAAVRQASNLPVPEFRKLAERMGRSRLAAVADSAHNVLGKSDDRGLPNLRDTLHSKLALWSDDAIQASVKRHDFDFEALKDKPATVYIDVPFDLMKPYAPWLRVILKSALDAMLRNTVRPSIPVLFVLDEFLALGPFPEFRDAIRTHAGAGVRLWFFLQDVASLEEHYPGATWRPFLNTSVKQFFGVDDPFTAELVGKYLGTATVGYRATNSGHNTSTQSGGVFDSNTGVTISSGESVQFVGRPLMTPDEVMALLSDWKGDGWRYGIVHLRGPRPFQVNLVTFDKSPSCKNRVGPYRSPHS